MVKCSNWYLGDFNLISNWFQIDLVQVIIIDYLWGIHLVQEKKMLTKREQCILKDAFCLVLLEEKLFNSAMRILSSIKNVS